MPTAEYDALNAKIDANFKLLYDLDYSNGVIWNKAIKDLNASVKALQGLIASPLTQAQKDALVVVDKLVTALK